jgi:hypothetical protein
MTRYMRCDLVPVNGLHADDIVGLSMEMSFSGGCVKMKSVTYVDAFQDPSRPQS